MIEIHFRRIRQLDRVLAALRNTIVLSCLLALGFIAGLFPATSPHCVQQYLFVLLNSSSGIYIFVSSILMNETVISSLRKRLRSPKPSITAVSSIDERLSH